jgi:acyl-coenzyme A synthetase/AMP-(fatty) acid ligase
MLLSPTAEISKHLRSDITLRTPCLYIFTSGTTGKETQIANVLPSLVLSPHQNINSCEGEIVILSCYYI